MLSCIGLDCAALYCIVLHCITFFGGRLGRGDDTVGSPHRAQISQFDIFEFILLLKLDEHFPVGQFEAAVSQSAVSSPPLTGAQRRPEAARLHRARPRQKASGGTTCIRPIFILRILRPRIFESKFRDHCTKNLDGALRQPTSFVQEFA